MSILHGPSMLPGKAKFVVCSIISLALSFWMKHLVIGQLQKPAKFTAFHWSTSRSQAPVPGRPTIWITVGQGPTALTVGAGGGCLDIFTLIYPFSPLSPSLWETARYRLKYCLKGPLNPKQPTNHFEVRLSLVSFWEPAG